MDVLQFPLQCENIIKNKRKIKKTLSAQLDNPKTIKIAVLGGSTTATIVDILELFLLQYNLRPEFYQSEYNQYWSDAVFENEALNRFHPDIVWIHTTCRNITAFPNFDDTKQVVSTLLNETFNHYQQMWEALRQKYDCTVIQNNFEMLNYRILGNRDAYDYRGRNRFLAQLNELFCQYAETHSGFYINDLNYISAAFGLEKWHDLRVWYSYKLAMSVDAVPSFALNLANLIKAIYGKNKKFISVDLDNTLWGGIIGDDGVEKIEIGHETAEGEAYLELQNYLLLLRSMGVILTVNSKNDESNALAGLNHPESTLKPNSFSVIKANWEPKNNNLRQTAEELNLGIDSAVFLDDNPFERNIVSENYPNVAVPAFETVTDCIASLDRNGYFEVLNLSADDLHRANTYRENAERRELQNQFSDYGDYLCSLNMKAEIKAFSNIYMSRIAQLTNKTNQFNLTTKRYTQAELETLSQSENCICLFGRLEDRFGDNGVVAVSIGRLVENTAHIDLWLMSCRVLKRGMECAMMDEFIRRAAWKGAERIRGVYLPTTKNGMVKSFYQDMGFQLVEQTADFDVWEIDIKNYVNRNVNISILTEENNGTDF